MLTGYRFNKNETRCQNDNQSEVSSYDLGQSEARSYDLGQSEASSYELRPTYLGNPPKVHFQSAPRLLHVLHFDCSLSPPRSLLWLSTSSSNSVVCMLIVNSAWAVRTIEKLINSFEEKTCYSLQCAYYRRKGTRARTQNLVRCSHFACTYMCAPPCCHRSRRWILRTCFLLLLAQSALSKR